MCLPGSANPRLVSGAASHMQYTMMWAAAGVCAPRPRARVLLAGWLPDRVFADPRRHHPVAGFGAAASALERVTYRDTRWAGVVHVGVLLGAMTLLGVAIDRLAGRVGGAGTTGALAVWT